MHDVNLKLDVFEGPFDLLFHLIEKNKINIYDIPIKQLTDQYLEYIENFENKNMDSISKFLIMAATLLEIKSKMLLPKHQDTKNIEEDPREELVSKIIEYKKFKDISEIFKNMQTPGAQVLYRKPNISLIKSITSNQIINLDILFKDIYIHNFYDTYSDLLYRKKTKIDEVRSSYESIEKDLYTIPNRIFYIKTILSKQNKTTFAMLCYAENNIQNKISIFLALLEMLKLRIIDITQKDNFEEILIYKKIIKNN